MPSGELFWRAISKSPDSFVYEPVSVAPQDQCASRPDRKTPQAEMYEPQMVLGLHYASLFRKKINTKHTQLQQMACVRLSLHILARTLPIRLRRSRRAFATVADCGRDLLIYLVQQAFCEVQLGLPPTAHFVPAQKLCLPDHFLNSVRQLAHR